MDIAYFKPDNASIIGADFIQENPGLSIPYLVILSVISVVGTFGNILVICAVVYQKELHDSMNLFIVNLAIADLCITAFVDPFSIVGVIHGELWFENKPALCEFIASTCLTSCFCSLLNSGMIAVNRYVHLFHANLYDKLYSWRNTLIMCVGLWVFSFLAEIPNFFGWGDFWYDRKSLGCVFDRTADLSYTIFFSIVGVVIPLSLIGLCYGLIYRYIKASQAKIKIPNVIGLLMPHIAAAVEQDMHEITRMTFITFITFVVCWTPYALVATIDYKDVYPRAIHLYAVLLAHANSSVNNIIYGISNRAFRHAYFRILGCGHCVGDIKKPNIATVKDSWSGICAYHATMAVEETRDVIVA